MADGEQLQVNKNPAERVAPSGDLVVVTPADGTTLKALTKGIIMSTGNDGTLSAIDAQGKIVNIPAGTLTTGVFYPFQLKEIRSTNTTATAVLCLF